MNNKPDTEKPFLTEEDIETLEQAARLFLFTELSLDIKTQKNPLVSFRLNQILSKVKQANARIAELESALNKAAEFKTYVHDRLDAMGIEKDPESPHKEKGCRIGGRLDIIEKERAELQQKVNELESSLEFLQKESIPINEIKKLREERDELAIAFGEYVINYSFKGENMKQVLEQFKQSQK